MAAHPHSRTHAQASRSGGAIRLPWWSLALPALAFGVLFLLVAEPGPAHAATGDPAVVRILERLQVTLAR
ncbi:hypothetical protein [Streptomyces paludis]|uniref:Uncharacterized protein n=1 Tax=Streptomyces paludis TaxID=2282738 RepID=A0A345I0A0_9ACTN|nr:hypothetical protein [Streptomyces paludis]AXG82374.1 hypothetical protein DVK44_05085 [Streptomyces paludis]